MGKVVAAVAIIAVAAAVAFAAPALAGLVVAKGTLAFTALSSVIATTLTIGAGALYKALSPAPGTTDDPGWQHSAPIALEWGKPSREQWPFMPNNAMHPIRPAGGGWGLFALIAGTRFALVQTRGTCLQSRYGRGWYAIVDREALIQAYQPFVFDVDDPARWQTMGARGWLARRWKAWTWGGLAKLFVGEDEARGVIGFEWTNPPTRGEVGRNRILWAYRVVAVERTLWGALRALWRVSRS